MYRYSRSVPALLLRVVEITDRRWPLAAPFDGFTVYIEKLGIRKRKRKEKKRSWVSNLL